MIFTPTSTYNLISNGAVRTPIWDISIRQVDTLSASLTSVSYSWTSVTDYISEIPDISNQIEYNVGQFSTNSINLKVKDISYWKSFFNFSYTGFYEAKISLILTQGSIIASDSIIPYSGIIDLTTFSFNEEEDTVEFTIFTLLDMADRYIGENISTKYISSDISASANQIIALQKIPGLYVSDASSLNKGIHTISYINNSSTSAVNSAKLDDGQYVSMTAGSSWILSAADNSKYITITQSGLGTIFSSTSEVSDSIIVLNQGDILPYQWFYGQSNLFMLEQAFSKFGINTINFDNLSLSSWDNSSRYSILANVRSTDYSNTGKAYSIAIVNNNPYFALGNKIYEFVLTADTISNRLINRFSLTAGQKVSKMIYNSNHGHLWFTYGTGTPGDGNVGKYTVSSGTLSTTAFSSIKYYNFEVMDISVSGEYCGMFVDRANALVYRVDPNTLSLSAINDLSSHGFNMPAGGSFQKQNNVYVCPSNIAGVIWWYETYWSGAVWSNSGIFVNADNVDIPTTIGNMAFDPIKGNVYYDMQLQDEPSTTSTLKYQIYSTNTVNVVGSYENKIGHLFYSPSNSKTYFTVRDIGAIASISGNGITSSLDSFTGNHVLYSGWSFNNNSLYGLDINGRLFQYSPEIQMYVQEGNFSGISVREALNNILNQYNLTMVVRPNKSAYIYKRADQNGNHRTSGNYLNATLGDTSQITQKVQYIQKIDQVRVLNNDQAHDYDGSNFDSSNFGNIKKLEIASDMLPSNILKDLAYWVYQFYKNKKDMFELELTFPKYEFEPFDGLSATDYSNAKINQSITGPIYSITYGSQGNTNIQVMV